MDYASALLPVPLPGGRVDHSHAAALMRLIKQDKGLPEHKKRSILEMLASPEAFDHLVSGAAGFAIARALAKYSELSPPARTLLSLAGFGLGNIMYNYINERKHTTFDASTGKSKILL
jgi:hypothetical protein